MRGNEKCLKIIRFKTYKNYKDYEYLNSISNESS